MSTGHGEAGVRVQLPPHERCRASRQVPRLHDVSVALARTTLPIFILGLISRFRTLRYAYMIDNVILLTLGTLHERDTRELLDRCHPLGVFDTMPALCVATNVEELYQSVLVETPLGEFCPAQSSR